MPDTTNETAETTTPATPAKVSPMVAVRKAFESAGGKFKDGKPILTTAQAKEAKAAAKELADAQSQVDAAEAALEAAKTASYAASAKLMNATGGTGITIKGREFLPMAKGEKLYYRTAGQRSSLDLG